MQLPKYVVYLAPGVPGTLSVRSNAPLVAGSVPTILFRSFTDASWSYVLEGAPSADLTRAEFTVPSDMLYGIDTYPANGIVYADRDRAVTLATCRVCYTDRVSIDATAD